MREIRRLTLPQVRIIQDHFAHVDAFSEPPEDAGMQDVRRDTNMSTREKRRIESSGGIEVPAFTLQDMAMRRHRARRDRINARMTGAGKPPRR